VRVHVKKNLHANCEVILPVENHQVSPAAAGGRDKLPQTRRSVDHSHGCTLVVGNERGSVAHGPGRKDI
jgi:hypothetical protein